MRSYQRSISEQNLYNDSSVFCLYLAGSTPWCWWCTRLTLGSVVRCQEDHSDMELTLERGLHERVNHKGTKQGMKHAPNFSWEKTEFLYADA